MGKGGGCFPSKSKSAGDDLFATPREAPAPVPLEAKSPTAAAVASDEADGEIVQISVHTSEVISAEAPSAGASAKVKVFIVFYSMYGHVASLAKRMKKGADSVDGVEGVLYRVPETLPQEALEKMHAPPKDSEIPVIAAAELVQADGVLFGFPTRFGAMAAQMKHFFDSTGQLWREQKLAGKPAGFFVSIGTQGGGMETTAWTSVTQLAHHGMLFVPIGYTFGAGMFKMDEVKGGSPYGAGVYAGDGTRQPTETELDLAEHQGKYMASIVKKFVQP